MSFLIEIIPVLFSFKSELSHHCSISSVEIWIKPLDCFILYMYESHVSILLRITLYQHFDLQGLHMLMRGSTSTSLWKESSLSFKHSSLAGPSTACAWGSTQGCFWDICFVVRYLSSTKIPSHLLLGGLTYDFLRNTKPHWLFLRYSSFLLSCPSLSMGFWVLH